MAFNNSCDYSPTQYNAQSGGANGALNNIAPSATSGVPIVSNGSSSQPSFTTATVAGGGTGDTSFTAYSVICGGTTSTGALQNVSGVGSSGQLLTSNGASSLPTWQASSGSAISSIASQVFTGNGTYTPTSGMLYCTVEALGGGGAGGGASNSNSFFFGSGGGAGGYCRKTFNTATIGSSQTVTIGAAGTGSSGAAGGNGGDTTFGSLLTAHGGTGGAVGAGLNTQVNGSAGGTASNGDINITGGTGGPGILSSGTSRGLRGSGYGAGSQYGGGGSGQYGAGGATDLAGIAATGYGAGGGGASSLTTDQAGGNGSGGIIIITEYV